MAQLKRSKANEKRLLVRGRHATGRFESREQRAFPTCDGPDLCPATRFCDVVAPIHAHWDALDAANVRLAKARDLLLPRLMNGEVAA